MISRSLTFFRQFNKELWILAVGWFVGALGFAASIPFIAIYFHKELGMSTIEIGLFFGGLAVVRSVFQVVGGEMSDRVGRRGLLIHSQLIRAVSFLMLGLVIAMDWGFWGVSVCLLVNSIFGAVFMPAVNAMVSDILPKEKRLDGYAISRSAGNLGWAIGPAIGGVLAATSYAILFYISAVITLASGLIFWWFLKVPRISGNDEPFRFKDLAEIRHDKNLAVHSFLILALYLVVAQMIAPFSVYTVEMVGISEANLGLLFGINGLMVVAMQIPVTRLLAKRSFTTQLAWGALLYWIGYGVLGMFSGFSFFALIMIVVTLGEVVMSPPSLTLTAHLAPEGRTGRYMGVYGFFVTIGWSMGPLYGGFFLDYFAHDTVLAWGLISSLALLSALGYFAFGRYLPEKYNFKDVKS
jgi:MFS family permease